MARGRKTLQASVTNSYIVLSAAAGNGSRILIDMAFREKRKLVGMVGRKTKSAKAIVRCAVIKKFLARVSSR